MEYAKYRVRNDVPQSYQMFQSLDIQLTVIATVKLNSLFVRTEIEWH